MTVQEANRELVQACMAPTLKLINTTRELYRLTGFEIDRLDLLMYERFYDTLIRMSVG